MSPVLPLPNISDNHEDLPPPITPLRFAAASANGMRFPTTNPHVQTTPHLNHRRMALDQQPRSLFEQKSTRSEEYGLPSQMAKHYQIRGCSPALWIKEQIRALGILFLSITLTKSRAESKLNVAIQYGAYFLQRFPELSTFVQVEIKYNKRYGKRSKAAAPLRVHKSDLVRNSNQPAFNFDKDFLLNKDNFTAHDKLGISVFAKSPNDHLEGS
jgi:hypothetical protein